MDRLPEGAPLGLRVYGSKVSEVSRAEGCKDTELTVPGRAARQGRAARHRQRRCTGKGRTPIGGSLLAVPDDLGNAEGRRSVVLVTDGGDNCAPPDPCKAAEEVAKRGVEMSISVVGFQVNERVRRQLRCIAEAGGGSYVDVGDADRLGGELSALLSRAFRAYEPTGTKVEGGLEPGKATLLGEGQYVQTIPSKDTKDRWFAIDVPAGRRAFVSLTAAPPPDSSGRGLFVSKLYPAASVPDDWIASDNQDIHGTRFDDTNGASRSQSLRMGLGDPPGRYVLSTGIFEGAGGFGLEPDVPIEIAVQFVKPGDSVDLVSAPGKLPTPTPSATPQPKATPATSSGSEDSGALGAWLVVLACLAGGIAVGLVASKVLLRRAAA